MKPSGKRRLLQMGIVLAAASMAASAFGQMIPPTRQPLPPAVPERPVIPVTPNLPPDVPDIPRVPSATLPPVPGTQGLTGVLQSGLGGVIGAPVRDVGRVVGDAAGLAQARLERLAAQARDNAAVLDLDPTGAPVVRGQLVLAQPSPQTLTAARSAGFTVVSEETLDGLDVRVVVLSAPPGLNTREAFERLAAAAPDAGADYNHLYAPSGMMTALAMQAQPPSAGSSSAPAQIGLVDTGVDAAHPALSAAIASQRGFAPGGVAARPHGTAVASLMAGRAQGFAGARPGARIDVADVYGSGPTGGSLDAVMRGLGWLGARRTPVINISLVGPPNRVLQAAVAALTARGVLIVAPVGNDGPAAPPAYPASYPGVIAVTGVDARDRLLIEAGRALHVDFAAPAVGLRAALPGGGYGPVRGTSFAAPIVAGKLAAGLARPDPAQAAASVTALGRTARRPGRDFGRGLVGAELRGRSLAGM